MKKRIAGVFLFLSALFPAGCGRKAASIGIIGGADGPTAVFVTGGPDWQNILGLAVIIVVAAAAARILRNRK